MRINLKKMFRKSLVLLLVLALAAPLAPTSLAHEQPQYDPNDVKAIQAFLRQYSGDQSNAQLLGWDIDDPASWEGVRWWVHAPIPQKVYTIYISDSAISNFTLSGLPELHGIYLSDNQLTHLELSDLPQLGKLDCSGNQLTTLPLSNLPALATIDCSGNQLTQLALSDLPSLKFLYCSDNQLSLVEMTQCRQWDILQVHDNPLDRAWATEQKGKVSSDRAHSPESFTYTQGGINYSLYSYYCLDTGRDTLLTIASNRGFVYGSASYGGMLIYPVPGEGFQFAGWDDRNGLTLYERTMDFAADDICQVISSKDNISVTAIMRPTGEECTESDVACYLRESGIGKEIGFGTIAPEKPVTRAEYLTVLMHAFDGRYHHADWEYRTYFDDIPYGTYCENAALKARELAITFGIGGNHFSPDTPITKQDLIAMTYRAMAAFGALNDMQPQSAFSRNEERIAEYAREPVRSLAEYGLVSGDSLIPTAEVSRAEAAQFIYNLLMLCAAD